MALGPRGAILSCISQSTKAGLHLRPFSRSFQDTHPDKLDIHQAGEGRTEGPVLTVIQLQRTEGWERRTLLPSCPPGETWRGERPGCELKEGDRTSGQAGRRKVSVLDAPVLTESQDRQSTHGSAPASTLHLAQDRKGGSKASRRPRLEGGRNGQPEPTIG